MSNLLIRRVAQTVRTVESRYIGAERESPSLSRLIRPRESHPNGSWITAAARA